MFDFELLAAILDTPVPLGPAFGQTTGPTSTGSQLYGAQIAASVAPLLKLELSLLARVQRAGQTVQTATPGETYVSSLRVFGDASGWRYAVEGAYELQQLLGSGDLVSAWAGAGYVEKTLEEVTLSPGLRLEADYASGAGADGSHAQFDPILPEVHSLHGAMDLFAWSNTMQASARATVVPWSEGRAAVEYRYVRQAENGTWQDGYLSTVGAGGGGELGHEVDAWTSWRPWPVLELVGGYSVFALSAHARYEVTSPSYTASLAHFAYLQATLRVP
jgi:hypothetical protein